MRLRLRAVESELASWWTWWSGGGERPEQQLQQLLQQQQQQHKQSVVNLTVPVATPEVEDRVVFCAQADEHEEEEVCDEADRYDELEELSVHADMHDVRCEEEHEEGLCGCIDDLRWEVTEKEQEKHQEQDLLQEHEAVQVFDEVYAATVADRIATALLQGPKYVVEGWQDPDRSVWQWVRNLLWELYGWWGKSAEKDAVEVGVVMSVVAPLILPMLQEKDLPMTRSEIQVAIIRHPRTKEVNG